MTDRPGDDRPAQPDLPDLGALLGGGGLPDVGSLLEGLGRVQGVQRQVFEGTAGGGLVRIRATGRLEVEAVEIDPAALEGADAEEVADLVHAALNDLTAKVAAAQKEAMGPLGGLLGG